MKRILVLALVCLLMLASTGCQVVTGENHTLSSGETLSGDLVVLGGDSILAQGSRITGSLVMMGGTVRANGSIDGDVSLSGGDITFGPTAVVRGSVHRTGGGLHLAQGASVPSFVSNQSLAVGGAGRAAASMLILFLMLLLALTIIALVLLTTWSSRAVAAAAEGRSSVDSIPASNQATITGSTSAGMGSGIALGIILVGLGIAFLFQQVLNRDVWNYTWPCLLLVPGLLCYAGMILGGKEAGKLAIPGSVLTMLGLIFVYQNTFNQFQSWAYAWALIVPTSLGIGRFIEGWWTYRGDLRESGVREMRSGLILFTVLAAFFELALNLSGLFAMDLGRFAFPTLLILIGMLLLSGKLFNRRALSS